MLAVTENNQIYKNFDYYQETNILMEQRNHIHMVYHKKGKAKALKTHRFLSKEHQLPANDFIKVSYG
jgi:hypothetical protein